MLGAVGRAKTEAKGGMKTPVQRVVFRGSAAEVVAVESARRDLLAAGVIAEFDIAEGEASIDVELAATE